MSDVTKADYIKLLTIITKAEENMPDWVDRKTKAAIRKLASDISDQDETSFTANKYKTDLKKAAAALKAVVAANKAGRPKGKEEEDAGWEIRKFVDDGVCEKAAKNAIPGVEAAYKKEKKKLLAKTIDEGHLGCLYESNILTQGDKYSFFFKYVRVKDNVADLVGVAVGCHSGSNYVRLDAKGKATTTKISAMKKI